MGRLGALFGRPYRRRESLGVVAFFTLLSNLSTILGLVKTLEELHTNSETKHTVSENLTKIRAAFDAKDTTLLDDVFNN